MSSNSNSINVPEARQAMESFKMECANEVGVNLKREQSLVPGVNSKTVQWTVFEEGTPWERGRRSACALSSRNRSLRSLCTRKAAL